MTPSESIPRCREHDDLIILKADFENLKREVEGMGSKFDKIEQKLDLISTKIITWSGIGMGFAIVIANITTIIRVFGGGH